MLAPGSFWGVIDRPNWLWWFDNHTAFLPFLHWLPDDLASDYAPHSYCSFMKAYALKERDDATTLDFARRGRGVSYHEFDLTLDENAPRRGQRYESVRARPQPFDTREVDRIAGPEVREGAAIAGTENSPRILSNVPELNSTEVLKLALSRDRHSVTIPTDREQAALRSCRWSSVGPPSTEFETKHSNRCEQ